MIFVNAQHTERLSAQPCVVSKILKVYSSTCQEGSYVEDQIHAVLWCYVNINKSILPLNLQTFLVNHIFVSR